MAAADFEDELLIFGAEEEAAQQYFFAYLLLVDEPAEDNEVLRTLLSNSFFWTTIQQGMLLSAFIVLGRIFDRDPRSHTIDTLMAATEKNLSAFSKEALVKRTMTGGVCREQAEALLGDVHELTAHDVNGLKAEIDHWRGTYVRNNYSCVRHKVFAHRDTSSATEANKMMEKTSREEMKDLFGFLGGLRSALSMAFTHGVKPKISKKKFDVSPHGGTDQPGERIYRQGRDVLRSLVKAESE
jgi:hypothetical protein